MSTTTAIVITVFLLIVLGLAAVLLGALVQEVRNANAKTEKTYAPTLGRARLMNAGRRPQTDWSAADRRVVPADAVPQHRRRQWLPARVASRLFARTVAPVPFAAAIGVSRVAPGLRVNPRRPEADVRRIFTQVMAAPVRPPAVAPADVDIEEKNRELAAWVADPNHTGPLPRVMS